MIMMKLTVFLYAGLFIAASNIGMTSPIGTSSGSCSTVQNNINYKLNKTSSIATRVRGE